MSVAFSFFPFSAYSMFKLIRWPNLLMIFFTQSIVLFFIIKNSSLNQLQFPPFSFFILSFGTVFIAAAGYIINDYYDVKIDLVNKPERLIISREISRRQAIFLHTIFNISAIILGFMLSWRVATFFAFCGFLLWVYSNYLKRMALVGNIVVSLLTAATVWVISLYFKYNNELIYVYSVFAFFGSLVREVIKDMEDTKGDAAYGCKTLPIVWGVRRTKYFLLVTLCAFLLLILGYSLTQEKSNAIFLFYLLLIPLIFLIYKIIWADKQKDYAFLSSFCKWYMLAGVISLGFI